MYIVTMHHPNRSQTDTCSPYLGEICIITGRVWYATGKMGPDLFASPEDALTAVKSVKTPFEYPNWNTVHAKKFVEQVRPFGMSTPAWLEDMRKAFGPAPVVAPTLAWIDD